MSSARTSKISHFRERNRPPTVVCLRLHIVTGRSLGLLQRRNGYVCSTLAAAVPSFLFPPLRASGHTQIVLATRDCVCLDSLVVKFLAVLALPYVATNYLPVHPVKAILCRLLGSPSANMLT